MSAKHELLSKMSANSVSMSYTGPFDGQVLAVLAKNIEYSLSDSPAVNKKMFKIFLELAQNISYYSAEQEKNRRGEEAGVGTLTIQEFDDRYVFSTGNLVSIKQADHIIGKCERINNLGRKGLREYKRKQRKLPAGAKGGGNIGLIQVALTSGNPVNYKMLPADEESKFYVVAVTINKSKKGLQKNLENEV